MCFNSNEADSTCTTLEVVKLTSNVRDVLSRLPGALKYYGCDRVHLLIGGSDCTELAACKRNRKGFAPGSGARCVFDFINVHKRLTYKHAVLLENTGSMANKCRNEISSKLGFDPLCIDSALHSPFHRKRLYWTNIKPTHPIMKVEGTALADLVDSCDPEKGVNGLERVLVHKGYTLRTWKGKKTTTLQEAWRNRNSITMVRKVGSDQFRKLSIAEMSTGFCSYSQYPVTTFHTGMGLDESYLEDVPATCAWDLIGRGFCVK